MSKSKKIKQIKKDIDEVEEDYDIESDTNESLYNEELDDDIDDIDENNEDNDENIEDIDHSECIMERIIEDEMYDEMLHDSEVKINNSKILLEHKNRISINRLTKYEMVRILGERTKQLTLGAKPLIKNYQSLTYEKIAEEELKLNMIPFKIKRYLPNNKYEIWSLNELTKTHLLSYLE
jgi:DNA-directed RNA polymerase I, II, and III subunit RPABC2